MITNKMISSLSKKLIIAFGIVAVVSSIFAPVTFAQTTQNNWYTPSFGDFNSKINADPKEEIFGERYTQAQVYWIIYSLINFFINGGFAECVSPLINTATTIDQSVADQITSCANQAGISGSIGMGPLLDLASLADNIKNSRPASGVEYISDKIHVDLIPTAYAQNTGFGFSTLSGAQHLWTATRDMTYALMVLVILILAFGVMFRVKLNPQTSITIQSAIPKIVIALIVITFSFAIAGLLIDLAYLVQGIVSTLVYTSGIVNRTVPKDGSAFTVIDFLTTMNNSSHGILSVGMLTVLFALIPSLIIGAVGGALIPGVGWSLGVVGGIILLLLLLLIFVIGLIKLIWLFLRTYAILLINIVFGPFIILAGAINLGGGVVGWIKGITAQLSVFVVSSILIMVAHIFIWGSNFLGNGSGNFFASDRALNPFNIVAGSASLGSSSLPGLGSGFDPGLLGFMVALVIILSIPSIASFVRDQISKPARLELGIGQAFGPVRTVAGVGTGVAGSRLASGYAPGSWQNNAINNVVGYLQRNVFR